MFIGAGDESGVSRKASLRAGDQKMVWTEPQALTLAMGIAWSAQDLFGGPVGRKRAGLEAVLTGTEGVLGEVQDAVGIGKVPATEPAACGRTQVPRSTEEAVFGEGAVESNGR